MSSIEFIIFYFIGAVIVFMCTISMFNCLKYLRSRPFKVQYFIYLLFYLFYILPVFSQLLIPSYQYDVFWRANDAMADFSSNLKYLVFVSIFSFLILKSARKDSKQAETKLMVNMPITNVCTIIVVGCFVITLAVSGLQVILGGYGYAYFNSEVVEVNEGIIGLGIVSYLVVLSSYRYISMFRLFYLTLIVFGFFWIVGKRYIIAETMIMAICVLAASGNIRGKTIVKSIIGGGAILLPLAFLYGVYLKHNVSSFLDYFNVDFSRQYTLVYQFYCEEIGRQISINKYDSIVYLFTFFIPRLFWFDKPYPFVNNLTYSLVGQDDVEFSSAGWATTCSIFSDLFDSFSFLGIIIGVMLFVWLFKKANNESRLHFKVMWIYFTVRILTVQLSSAIFQIVIMTIILYLLELLYKRKAIVYNPSRRRHLKQKQIIVNEAKSIDSSQ